VVANVGTDGTPASKNSERNRLRKEKKKDSKLATVGSDNGTDLAPSPKKQKLDAGGKTPSDSSNSNSNSSSIKGNISNNKSKKVNSTNEVGTKIEKSKTNSTKTADKKSESPQTAEASMEGITREIKSSGKKGKVSGDSTKTPPVYYYQRKA
jgi:hypothetical protein